MFNANRLAPLLFCMLLPAAVFAEDSVSSEAAAESAPVVTASVDDLLAASESEWRSELIRSLATVSYLDHWQHSTADFRFREANALLRMKKLRRLSLLTLADTRRTKLFVGVNADGLLGLHLQHPIP